MVDRKYFNNVPWMHVEASMDALKRSVLITRRIIIFVMKTRKEQKSRFTTNNKKA
jgi:hypothetical protein